MIHEDDLVTGVPRRLGLRLPERVDEARSEWVGRHQQQHMSHGAASMPLGAGKSASLTNVPSLKHHSDDALVSF